MNNFQSYLKNSLTIYHDEKLHEAMSYALLSGGKRIRPKLIFQVLKAYHLPVSIGYAYACALEYIHTYSLIHDDLPAMDNDDLRRGKATLHRAFGEDLAILTGDALLTEAFYQALQSNLSAKQNNYAIAILSKEAGANGMVLGQVMDMSLHEGDNLEHILTMIAKKTGCLLVSALQLGAIAANHFENLDIFAEIGKYLGYAFQIQDDLLDVEKTCIQLGKSTSDKKNHKQTIVHLLGIEKAHALQDKYYQESIDYIKKINNFDSDILIDYIRVIQKRQY